MSEMVERVARVFDVDAYLPEGAAGILLPRKIRRADAEALARKVIAAMREPTAGMVDAAYSCDIGDDCHAPRAWQAMIDEALK